MKDDKTPHNRNSLILRGAILNILVNLPVILGLLILVVPNEPITNRRAAFGAFVMGMAGIIQVIRKEIPGPFLSIRGKSAIFLGIAFVIMLWSISLLLLILD